MNVKRMPIAALASALAVALAVWTTVQAADHADGGAATNDPAADVDDVYAWTSSDARFLNLAMTIGRNVPATFQFSDRVQYVFHVNSKASFTAAQSSAVEVICEFDVSQQVRCWAGTAAFAGGDARSTSGVSSGDGRMKIFTGRRNDPFFFNLAGFNATATTVGTVAGSLRFDAAGCPQLDAATAGTLVTSLRSAPGGGAPADSFRGFNALALVVQIDKALVTPGGPIVGVWASTHRL